MMEQRNKARSRSKRIGVTLLGALLACSVASPAFAAPIPFPARTVKLTAQSQKLDEVLKDFFGQTGLNVRISSAVTGNVQGRFLGRPSEIWNLFATAYRLVAYYDGSAVQVYSATEIRSRTIAAQAPTRVVSEAIRLGLVDGSNTVTAGSNSVSVSGVPAFVERISAIAGTMNPSAVPVIRARPMTTPPQVMLPKTTSTVDVIRPPKMPAKAADVIAPPKMRYNAPDIVVDEQNVRPNAAAKQPYEIRVFYLKYAKASDQRVIKDGREIVTRGVASMLWGLMGDGAANAMKEAKGPRIEADEENNAVIVRDVPASMQTYQALIAAIDIPTRPQGHSENRDQNGTQVQSVEAVSQ